LKRDANTASLFLSLLTMKKYYYLVVSLLLCSITAHSQQDAGQLYENAKSFMLQGDYSNAILLLTKAHQLKPNDLEITKDLALNYYFQKEDDQALQAIKPVLDRDDADDQCYQIAGNIYKELDQPDECEKLYKKGIKKFPQSGAIYNDYGELLQERNDNTSIDQWEKGIQVDPSYSRNYYNACKYYYINTNNIWCIIYAETFVDMEPLNTEGPEIKDILLESYKRLFASTTVSGNNAGKNKFENAFMETMNKQNDIALEGINPETLTMIRTRFILDWYKNYADKFPFRLFDFQRQLLKAGMFDAYDQWLFGGSQNLAAYQNWVTTHDEEYNQFNHFQQGRTFKVPAGQYYK
jgi:Tfp pilus assembly protein PilF